MNQESALIKYLVKEVIYGNCQPQILEILSSPKINLSIIKKLLSYHELGPYLYAITKDNPKIFPPEFHGLLKSTYYRQIFDYMHLYDEFIRILKESKKNNLLILPIKGFSYAEEYYKRFGFRPLVDIDLLIREEELEKGINLLEKLGFKKDFSGNENYWRKEQCHLTFTKKIRNSSVIVELHWDLDFKRGKKKALPSIWERIRKVEMENETFFTLSPEDTIFSLALHQRRFGKLLNLKYTCDTGIILEKEILDWDYIFKTAFEEKIRASLYLLLFQAQFVMDKDLNEYLNKLRIPFWKRKILSGIVTRYMYSPQNYSKIHYIYTLCHFFIYDNMIYPLKYTLNIPQEQFAKFYLLPIYAKKTNKLYKIRFLYIIYRLVKDGVSKLFEKRLT